MTTKKYLSKIWQINRLIDAKLERVRILRDLAAKATSTLALSPPSGVRTSTRMEDIIIKIVDLTNEINTDIDGLVDLKRNISQAIHTMSNSEHKMLLELRYLCFKTWEEIAEDFNYSIRHVHRIHGEALLEFAREELIEISKQY